MATLSYPEQSTPYGQSRAEAAEPARRDMGSTIFIWVAWAAAALFWGAALTTAVNILGTPAPAASPTEADAGGIGGGLMTVVGAAVLGLAILYGFVRYLTRDKRKDPMTEAATHALYDRVEAAGGDDVVSLSPEAHRPEERAAYKDAISRQR